MRIIISPAKKMNIDVDTFAYRNLPDYLEQTEILLDHMKQWRYEEAKAIWKCNDKLADLNWNRIKTMNLQQRLTPAIISYEGIQYQYMAPKIMDDASLEYIEEHLRILSGFYGMLRPFDGVTPYRLEMQAKIGCPSNDLYQFWGDKLAQKLEKETNCIVNLASKEYSKAIEKHLSDHVRFITCSFGELVDNKVKEKGTQCKMARGEMVRYMAEKQIHNVEDIKKFDRLGYRYNKQRSDESTYVFILEDSKK